MAIMGDTQTRKDTKNELINANGGQYSMIKQIANVPHGEICHAE